LTKSSNQYKETSHIFSYYIVKTLLVYNHSDLLKSTIFDINFSTKINISLKSDPNSINTFFIKLLSYAYDNNFINIINKVSAYTKTNARSIYKQNIISSKAGEQLNRRKSDLKNQV
jgi:hypothetical protein